MPSSPTNSRTASDGKVAAAVEELLRYDNPVEHDVRRSMRDVTLHGVTIPASTCRTSRGWRNVPVRVLR